MTTGSSAGAAAVRVGVIGCADIARRRVLPAFAAAPEIELTAVASRDAAKAALVAGEFGCAAVTDYAKLLLRSDVDAVYVALPAALHAEWVERALRAGKHVLGEKPLTTDARQTRELLALADDLGLVVMENVMFPQHHQHAQVHRLVADGAIGDLRCFSAAFAIPPLPAQNIRYRPELGGGALLDLGVYPLLAAQLFLGTDLDIIGATLRHAPDSGVDVAGAALLQTPEGVTAQLTFGLEHAYRARYELWGSEGRIRVERAFAPPPDHRPTVVLEQRDGIRQVPLEPDDQYVNTARAFARAILHGAPDHHQRTLALADLLDRIRRSSTSFSVGRQGLEP